MKLARYLKSKLKDALRAREVYAFTAKSLPRNIDLAADINRLKDQNSLNTIFDIGANVGGFTRTLRGAFPSAQVYAFEPVLDTYRRLVESVGQDKRVTCEHLAITSECGIGNMIIGENSLVAHLDKNDEQTQSKKEQVETITIDSYCAKSGISAINLLKTDTEGNDLAVIEGARNLITSGSVDFILSEVGFSSKNEHNTFLGSVFDVLTDYNFDFVGLYDTRDATYSPDLRWADALFARSSLKR